MKLINNILSKLHLFFVGCKFKNRRTTKNTNKLQQDKEKFLFLFCNLNNYVSGRFHDINQDYNGLQYYFFKIKRKLYYFWRLLINKSKMEYFKTQVLHYGKLRDMLIGIEYDINSNLTILESKIIGSTIVTGSVDDFEGDILDTLKKRYQDWDVCSRETFVMNKIGNKIK